LPKVEVKEQKKQTEKYEIEENLIHEFFTLLMFSVNQTITINGMPN